MSIYPTAWLFIIFGILGIFAEVFYTALENLLRHGSLRLMGCSYVWMFPIYGLIALLFHPIHSFVMDRPWYLRGAVYMTVIYAVEYMSGALLKKIVGEPIWQYKGRFQLQGHIELAHAPVWFGLGLLLERGFATLVHLSIWLSGNV